VIVTNQGICDPSYRNPDPHYQGNVINAGMHPSPSPAKVEKEWCSDRERRHGDKTGSARPLAGKTGVARGAAATASAPASGRPSAALMKKFADCVKSATVKLQQSVCTVESATALKHARALPPGHLICRRRWSSILAMQKPKRELARIRAAARVDLHERPHPARAGPRWRCRFYLSRAGYDVVGLWTTCSPPRRCSCARRSLGGRSPAWPSSSSGAPPRRSAPPLPWRRFRQLRAGGRRDRCSRWGMWVIWQAAPEGSGLAPMCCQPRGADRCRLMAMFGAILLCGT